MRLRRNLVLTIFFSLAVAGAAHFESGQVARTQEEQGGKIHHAVLQTLQTEPEVRVIIHLVSSSDPQASVSEVRRAIAKRQAAVLDALEPADFTVMRQYSDVAALAGRLTAGGIGKLSGHPDVAIVSIDVPISPALTESGPLVRAPEVHAAGFDGTGVNVAVLDTGIDNDHPDLASSIIGEECFVQCPNGTDRQSGPGSAPDGSSHGTHVSGIITSDGTVAPLGIAPGAGVFAYRVFGETGTEYDLASTLLGALDHILMVTRDRDPLPPLTPIINLSGGQFEPRYPSGTCRADQPAIDQVFADLWEEGVIAFVATGNEKETDAMRWPACIPTVVSVGAVYDDDVGQWWLNCLPLVDQETHADKVACFSNSSDALDVLAPGVPITSAFIGGAAGEMFGTSMASPHAAAIAALLKQAAPAYAPEQIERSLKLSGKWVTDHRQGRRTTRVDARVALVTDPAADHDLDGCTNGQELGTVPGHGGLRNPLDKYDYYDINHDGSIAIGADILRVAAAFGNSSGVRYHAVKDRGARIGVNPWNGAGPDGDVAIGADILAVAQQFGHQCSSGHVHGPTPFGPHPTTLSTTINAGQVVPFAMSVGSTAGFPGSGRLLVGSETFTYDQNAGVCGGFTPATQFCVTVRSAATKVQAGELVLYATPILANKVSSTQAAPFAMSLTSPPQYGTNGAVRVGGENMRFDQGAGVCGSGFDPSAQLCIIERASLGGGSAQQHSAGAKVLPQ